MCSVRFQFLFTKSLLMRRNKSFLQIQARTVALAIIGTAWTTQTMIELKSNSNYVRGHRQKIFEFFIGIWPIRGEGVQLHTDKKVIFGTKFFSTNFFSSTSPLHLHASRTSTCFRLQKLTWKTNFFKYNLEVALLKYLSFIGPRAISLAFPFKMLWLHRIILTFVLIFNINTGKKQTQCGSK